MHDEHAIAAGRTGRARTLRILRASLPIVALLVFAATLVVCYRVASEQGHLAAYHGRLPVISTLGRLEPEHTWFERGFSLLAVITAAVFGIRARQLREAPGVVRSPGLRRANHLCSALAGLSLLAMLVMAWVPDSRDPTHFIAALATFGLLASYEGLHALIVLVLLVRSKRADPGAPSPPAGPGWLATAWMMACPAAAVFLVGAWVVQGEALPQYLAVAFNFAYFLALIPEFAREGEVASPPLQTE